ncbi:hypothetical protein KIN20_014128 [Parelaphostrongylus tenuis]|uniref:Uncharacterized protein n=1 Tax=Parelaphostrongylus tenuis TaxID=148309 RepID=A0AAD5MD53_PARTN|nr:hypothetical protein KIN20_014128 [Parelaphostrongylus tenuis]
MRVIHIIKAFQVTFAITAIYLLLSVAELCELNEQTTIGDASVEKTYARLLGIEKLAVREVTNYTDTYPSTEADTSERYNGQETTPIERREVGKLANNEGLSVATNKTVKGVLKKLRNSAESTIFPKRGDSSTAALEVHNKREASATNNDLNTHLLNNSAEKISQKIGVGNIVGIGDVTVPYAAAIRVPVACLTLSIVIACFTVMKTDAPLHREILSRIFAENIPQVLFWTISGITLLVIRRNWYSKWDGALFGTFVPDYPDNWYFVQVICNVMVIVVLAELCCYDHMFYKIRIADMFGDYRVGRRPESEYPIYTVILEIIEEDAP